MVLISTGCTLIILYRPGTSSGAPPSKRITCSDMFACKMLENMLCDVDRPWEQHISSNAVSANRGKARKIPALHPTGVFCPWQLFRRDVLQPVWKQQHLFSLCLQREERHMKCMHRISISEQQIYLDHPDIP
jgi:hypothetical protein